jgi:hypothetical protein
MGVAEMEDRRRKARLLKVAPWFIPIFVVGATAMAIHGGSVDLWLAVAATALAVYGSAAAYRIGVRWEQRWDELIRTKGPT